MLTLVRLQDLALCAKGLAANEKANEKLINWILSYIVSNKDVSINNLNRIITNIINNTYNQEIANKIIKYLSSKKDNKSQLLIEKLQFNMKVVQTITQF